MYCPVCTSACLPLPSFPGHCLQQCGACGYEWHEPNDRQWREAFHHSLYGLYPEEVAVSGAMWYDRVLSASKLREAQQLACGMEGL